MALSEVGTVVVLRCSYASVESAFDRDGDAHAEAGWDVYVGANEARFAARRQGDATLVMPRVGFESTEELAVHLREILGDVLDEHEDERGIAWLPKAPEPDDDATYEKLVDGDHEWAEKLAKDDERLKKEAGALFGAAAKNLHTDEKVITRVEASAVAAPLDDAKDKLDEAADKRDDRSSMRRSLGSATGSSFMDSPLAKKATNKPDVTDLGKKRNGLSGALGGGNDQVAELESSLRDAVEGDVVASVGNLDAVEPPKVDEEGDGEEGDDEA